MNTAVLAREATQIALTAAQAARAAHVRVGTYSGPLYLSNASLADENVRRLYGRRFDFSVHPRTTDDLYARLVAERLSIEFAEWAKRLAERGFPTLARFIEANGEELATYAVGEDAGEQQDQRWESIAAEERGIA